MGRGRAFLLIAMAAGSFIVATRGTPASVRSPNPHILMFAMPGAEIDRRGRTVAALAPQLGEDFREAPVAALRGQQAQRKDRRARASSRRRSGQSEVVGEAERRRVHDRRLSPAHKANNDKEINRAAVGHRPNAGRNVSWRISRRAAVAVSFRPVLIPATALDPQQGGERIDRGTRIGMRVEPASSLGADAAPLAHQQGAAEQIGPNR